MSGIELTGEEIICAAVDNTLGMRKAAVSAVSRWFGVSEARVRGAVYGIDYKPFNKREAAAIASLCEPYFQKLEAELEQRQEKLRARLGALRVRRQIHEASVDRDERRVRHDRRVDSDSGREVARSVGLARDQEGSAK